MLCEDHLDSRMGDQEVVDVCEEFLIERRVQCLQVVEKRLGVGTCGDQCLADTGTKQ